MSGLKTVNGDFAPNQRAQISAERQDLFVQKSRRKPPEERLTILQGLVNKCRETLQVNEEKIETLQTGNADIDTEIEQHLVEIRSIETDLAEKARLAAEVAPLDSVSVATFQAVAPAVQKKSDLLP